jgi:hypothetical protein
MMTRGSDRPDPDLPQDPAIPGSKVPEEVPPDAEPAEPPPPDGSERPAAPEERDQEGQRRFEK